MNIRNLQQIIADAEVLKTVAQAYSEISASKLQKIRGSMQNNIDFAKEVGDVAHQVRVESIKRGLPLPKKLAGVVQILITSNNRFYGNLEKPLTRYFAESTAKVALSSPQTKSLRFVVGKTGATFLKDLKYNLAVTPWILKKDIPDGAEFATILKTIKDYQTILVYHSRFKTVLTQIPVISDISQSLITPSEIQEKLEYFFEPELKKILEFFEGQILQILLDQTFLESELARTASRLISMDKAETNANDYLKTQKLLLGAAKQTVENNKLLEIVAASYSQKKSASASRGGV